ncbi:hypothetical protein DSO57_1035854 [Entomophthora muscae]|uniref:Uncharacterized protein n=1 Tax=Entomophthora muscae TaxID=34485 RepID=A0ACC2RQG2_9FUNG|nr:hypothetical protein DSO57_1035854 [Entomophthora muscae]
MENSTIAHPPLEFLYGHLLFKGTPALQAEERGPLKQFLVDQNAVEDSNMFLPNLTHVKDFASYAYLNACSDSQLKRWDCRVCRHVPDVTFVISFDNYIQGARGYLAVDHARNRIICSFRGMADTRNKLEAQDIIRSPLSYANESEVTVASGFLHTMESLDFLLPLKKLVIDNRYLTYKVAFIGHSLGGAFASLALTKAQAILNIDWKRLELYTYGQPRTGNTNFARWYNRKPIASARVVNNTDPIPHLTGTTVTDYRHHMNELWIQGPHNDYRLNICSNDQLEDSDCSISTSPLNYVKANHQTYFDIDFTQAC